MAPDRPKGVSGGGRGYTKRGIRGRQRVAPRRPKGVSGGRTWHATKKNSKRAGTSKPLHVATKVLGTRAVCSTAYALKSSSDDDCALVPSAAASAASANALAPTECQ